MVPPQRWTTIRGPRVSEVCTELSLEQDLQTNVKTYFCCAALRFRTTRCARINVHLNFQGRTCTFTKRVLSQRPSSSCDCIAVCIVITSCLAQPDAKIELSFQFLCNHIKVRQRHHWCAKTSHCGGQVCPLCVRMAFGRAFYRVTTQQPSRLSNQP